MKVLFEREALDFLDENGFKVVQREFVRSRFGLRKSLLKVGPSFVLKASGKNLPSKGNLGMVQGIKTYTKVRQEFKRLKKIKGADGVLVQKKISGKEFFLSIKKNSPKKHSISFGFFVINKDKEREVILKVYPDAKKNLKNIIEEGNKILKISAKEKKALENFILDLLKFIQKNKSLSEVVVKSLIVNGRKATIVNARIEFN